MTLSLILSILSSNWSATAETLATKAGVDKATVLRALRALATRGFVFCDDDFDGRRRAGGKYTNALWCMNCETSGLTVEQAASALSKPGHGSDTLRAMGLGV